jgi:hypothetical protein
MEEVTGRNICARPAGASLHPSHGSETVEGSGRVSLGAASLGQTSKSGHDPASPLDRFLFHSWAHMTRCKGYESGWSLGVSQLGGPIPGVDL